jgi:hypothetical protein
MTQYTLISHTNQVKFRYTLKAICEVLDFQSQRSSLNK